MILKKQIAAFAPPVVKIGSEGVAGVSMHSMQWSLTEGLLMKICRPVGTNLYASQMEVHS